jgi:hypothetical protein
MKNIQMSREGDILVIKIDLTKKFGPSASGKTTIVATTEGPVSPPDVSDMGMKIGINVYTK